MGEVFEQRMIKGEPQAILAILRDPGSWLENAAETAAHFGHAVDVKLRGELGLGKAHVGVRKVTRLEVGDARLVRDHFVVPVTWEASGYAGLFPVMDAVVEIHRAGRDRSRVVFWGRYDPPLGRAGELIDKLVAHRTAEATVRYLFDALAEKAEPSSSPDGVLSAS